MYFLGNLSELTLQHNEHYVFKNDLLKMISLLLEQKHFSLHEFLSG